MDKAMARTAKPGYAIELPLLVPASLENLVMDLFGNEVVIA